MIKIPIYDFQCEKCEYEFEEIVVHDINIKYAECPKCRSNSKRLFPKKASNFNLKYNPVTDSCDWSGNSTRYWEDYKKMKAEGKNPRIPKLDGDG